MELIIGFVLGCGCAVALLFFLKPVPERVLGHGLPSKEKGRQEEAVSADGKEGELTMEDQLANFMSFNGTPQIRKDVNKVEN